MCSTILSHRVPITPSTKSYVQLSNDNNFTGIRTIHRAFPLTNGFESHCLREKPQRDLFLTPITVLQTLIPSDTGICLTQQHLPSCTTYGIVYYNHSQHFGLQQLRFADFASIPLSIRTIFRSFLVLIKRMQPSLKPLPLVDSHGTTIPSTRASKFTEPPT